MAAPWAHGGSSPTPAAPSAATSPSAPGRDDWDRDSSPDNLLPYTSSPVQAAPSPTELGSSALVGRFTPGVEFFGTATAVKHIFMVGGVGCMVAAALQGPLCVF
jgi:hypothetical protein